MTVYRALRCVAVGFGGGMLITAAITGHAAAGHAGTLIMLAGAFAPDR